MSRHAWPFDWSPPARAYRPEMDIQESITAAVEAVRLAMAGVGPPLQRSLRELGEAFQRLSPPGEER